MKKASAVSFFALSGSSFAFTPNGSMKSAGTSIGYVNPNHQDVVLSTPFTPPIIGNSGTDPDIAAMMRRTRTSEATLKFEYNLWSGKYRKEQDGYRYELFKYNYLKAAISGKSVALNEFGDCTQAEYEVRMANVLESGFRVEDKMPDPYLAEDQYIAAVSTEDVIDAVIVDATEKETVLEDHYQTLESLEEMFEALDKMESEESIFQQQQQQPQEESQSAYPPEPVPQEFPSYHWEKAAAAESADDMMEMLMDMGVPTEPSQKYVSFADDYGDMHQVRMEPPQPLMNPIAVDTMGEVFSFAKSTPSSFSNSQKQVSSTSIDDMCKRIEPFMDVDVNQGNPISRAEEEMLQQLSAAVKELGERCFEILKDLCKVQQDLRGFAYGTTSGGW